MSERVKNSDGGETMYLNKEEAPTAREIALREAMFREGVHVFPVGDIRPHVVDDFHPTANPCFCFFRIEWIEGLDRKPRPVVTHARMNN